MTPAALDAIFERWQVASIGALACRSVQSQHYLRCELAAKQGAAFAGPR